MSEAGSAEAVEQRSSSELRARLRDTQAEALLLYTEYSARTGGDLKTFFANMTGFKEEVVRGIGREYDSVVSRELIRMKICKGWLGWDWCGVDVVGSL